MSDEKPAAGFVPLKTVKHGRPDQASALAEIRQIYFRTSRQTIEHDFAHAIELLKSLPDDESRSKAHVYMEGLAEMRKEWGGKTQQLKVKRQKAKAGGQTPTVTARAAKRTGQKSNRERPGSKVDD